ncbi:methyltransferase-like 26 [Planococcus citri]|uniref:methyltransferase-like 26 n=1 Tax=Planococcus citri TaxID=170843 RepID=UPI0031FA1EEC
MKILREDHFFCIAWLTFISCVKYSYASLYSEELDPVYGTRKFAPTNRYKEAIAEHLSRFVKNNTIFVEITSGTGQLISFLADYFPAITFVPSDHDPYNIPSIEFYKKLNMVGNLKAPFLFDVRIDSNKWFKRTMQNETVDYIFNSYLIHLAPPECYKALIQGVNQYLKHRGLFFLFGPFKYLNNTLTEADRIFDQQLKEANPLWGLRDAEEEIRVELEKLNILLCVTFNFAFDLQLQVYKKGTRVLW